MTLLPGLTYYDGPVSLGGRLVFLLCELREPRKTTAQAVSLYEFDLKRKELRRVMPCPGGLLACSRSGNLYCILHGQDRYDYSWGTNVFVYSPNLQRTNTVELSRAPWATIFVGEQVFFRVPTADGYGILRYHLASNQLSRVELKGASNYERQNYDHLHPVDDTANALHFWYNHYGRRLIEGQDYNPGYYSFALDTGEITWVAVVENRPLGHLGLVPTAFDGSEVFFAGPAGGSPIEGAKLVSSDKGFWGNMAHDPKGKHLKVLKQFSPTAKLSGISFFLRQVSPCGHYAFVERYAPITKSKSGMGSRVSSYYVVDVSTGKTWLMLESHVEQDTQATISEVHWVGDAGNQVR